MSKIGIIYSPGFGAGWSTWGQPEQALDQTLANLIASEAPYTDWEKYCEEKYPEEYLGGLSDCVVEWVEEGTLFKIDEYDGSESVMFKEDDNWQIAK